VRLNRILFRAPAVYHARMRLVSTTRSFFLIEPIVQYSKESVWDIHEISRNCAEVCAHAEPRDWMRMLGSAEIMPMEASLARRVQMRLL